MVRLVLLRVLESYFRHRWLYLLPVVLMAGLAAVYLLTASPKYQAEGVLYVENESLLASLNAVRTENTSWWITPAQLTVNQLSELLQTDAFVRAIIQQTDLEAEMDQGPDTVDTLIEETRKGIWTYPLGDNQLLVSAVSENPEVASQLVTATIEGYVQWQINAQRADSETAQVFFGELIQTYEAELIAAREEMKRFLIANPEPIRGDRPGVQQIELARLQGDIDLAASRYASALEKEENTRLALAQIETEARQSYLLIDAPTTPDSPNTSLRELAMTVGVFLAVGVALSLVAVVGSALLDHSFRLPEDVTTRLDLPVLALVPDATRRRSRFEFDTRRAAGRKKTEEFPVSVPTALAGASAAERMGKSADVTS